MGVVYELKNVFFHKINLKNDNYKKEIEYLEEKEREIMKSKKALIEKAEDDLKEYIKEKTGLDVKLLKFYNFILDHSIDEYEDEIRVCYVELNTNEGLKKILVNVKPSSFGYSSSMFIVYSPFKLVIKYFSDDDDIIVYKEFKLNEIFEDKKLQDSFETLVKTIRQQIPGYRIVQIYA